MPMRVLAVTGMHTAVFIAAMHSATNSGDRIMQAPKFPDTTRSLGQPKLRLISENATSSITLSRDLTGATDDTATIAYNGTDLTLTNKDASGDVSVILAGGTGIASSGSGTTATFAIDATVATLAGSQTLTTKTIVLGNNTVSGALANGITATTQSASDNTTKVATTAYVDNQVTAGAVNEFGDNVFRVKDNSDASKKLAFECSGISGSTTRTMTVPNTDGTISTESFATAIAVALG